MLRYLYLPTKPEMESSKKFILNSREGILLFIPLTLTIGFFGFIMSHFVEDND
jgi:hypothetical protein